MGEARTLRVRAVVATWFTALLVVGAATVLAGAWATYTAHVEPGETTTQETESVAAVSADVTHGANVTEPNPLFPIGTRLQNRSTYFRGVAPVLDSRVTVSQRGLANATADVRTQLRLSSADEDTVYWRERRPLDQTDGPLTEPLTLDFTLNVTQLADRIATIEETLGSPGETTVTVLVTAEVSGTADGQPVERTVTREIRLGVTGDTYSVTPAGSATTSVDRTTVVRTERTYGPLRTIGGPVALFVGLGGVAALLVTRFSQGVALTPRERARLAYLDDRAEFDEWIVSIQLPDDDRPIAHADSLADLVDLAIDSDTSVVRDGDRFVVVEGEYRYVYEPPEPVETTGLFPAITTPPASSDDEPGDSTAGTDSPDGATTDSSNGTEPVIRAGSSDDPTDGGDSPDGTESADWDDRPPADENSPDRE